MFNVQFPILNSHPGESLSLNPSLRMEIENWELNIEHLPDPLNLTCSWSSVVFVPSHNGQGNSRSIVG
jgi:hypothetical protein